MCVGVCWCERIVYRHGAILLIVRECSVLTLGGDDIEDSVPDSEQLDSEREEVEVRDKEKGDKTRRQQTHAQTCDIMDGM